MILAMTLTYMVFAILLNSVGTLILQAIHSFGVDKQATSVLDAFKDLPIAIVSFLVASWLPRLGYRRAMMLGLGAVAVACVAMPLFSSFWMIKLMFATTGAAFALVKVSVYSTIGLLTDDSPSTPSPRTAPAIPCSPVSSISKRSALRANQTMYGRSGAVCSPDGCSPIQTSWVAWAVPGATTPHSS